MTSTQLAHWTRKNKTKHKRLKTQGGKMKGRRKKIVRSNNRRCEKTMLSALSMRRPQMHDWGVGVGGVATAGRSVDGGGGGECRKRREGLGEGGWEMIDSRGEGQHIRSGPRLWWLFLSLSWGARKGDYSRPVFLFRREEGGVSPCLNAPRTFPCRPRGPPPPHRQKMTFFLSMWT